MLPVDLRRFMRAQMLVCLLAVMSVAVLSCGVDAPAESGDISEGGDSVDPRIRGTDRIYTIDEMKATGVKANKEYDVEDLPGAESAFRMIFNQTEFEARFYPDHQTAIDQGWEYADHVTGDDAVVTGDDVLWEEGAKDRRRCSRHADTPHSGCSYSSRYWDFVVIGNMVLMCEGLESKASLDNCDDFLANVP